jgi:protein-L-isoaspartate(D-aspartate) O-methyltransferase
MDTSVSSFQQRLWAAQRIAWVVFTALLIFAGLGAFGSTGPLSDKTAASGPFRIKYERVMRASAASLVEWEVATPDSGKVQIDVDSTFREALSIESLDPEPDREELREYGARMQFSNQSPGARVIRATVKARRFGRYTVSVRLADGDWVPLSIIVLP